MWRQVKKIWHVAGVLLCRGRHKRMSMRGFALFLRQKYYCMGRRTRLPMRGFLCTGRRVFRQGPDWVWGWQKGSTLMEVVLAVAIFSLILTAALAFYAGGLQSWSRGVSALDRQQNARIAMDIIVRELRYALSLEGLQDGDPLPFYSSEIEDQQGGSRLCYTNVDGHNSELCFNETKKNITLKVKRGSPNELAYNVAGLDFFRYLPPGGQAGNLREAYPLLLVRIKLQGKGSGQQKREAPYILQSVVRLQNLPLSDE